MAQADVLGYLESKGLRIKRAGGWEVNTHCPFHGEDQDKRGRLYVNVDPDAEIPGLFMCHVCGEKGNLVTLKKHYGDSTSEVEDDSYERLAIFKIAAKFYAKQLQRHDDVLDWLHGPERGLTDVTISKFHLGYAPQAIEQDLATDTVKEVPTTALYRYLRECGFEPKEILATGLCVEAKSSGRIIDSFAGMVTIPYMVTGSVVDIRGRAFPERDDRPKYKTCSGRDTRLFNTDALWNSEEVIATEGEFDAMILDQLGYPNVVGFPGAKSYQQNWNTYFAPLRRLWLVFDRDKAGEEGAEKVVKEIGPKVRRIHLSPIGFKTDPTAWVAKGNTAEDFKELLDKARKGNLLVSVEEAVQEFETIQDTPGLKFGWDTLDVMIDPGLQPAQVFVVLAKTGTGKALRWDERVATPTGWAKIGSLRPGDEVIGSDGTPTLVTGVFPQGVRELVELTMSDGVRIACDLDHLWTYQTRNDVRHGRWRTTTTAEMLKVRSGVYFPTVKPVSGNPVGGIDAYTLGALIGDASFRHSGLIFSSVDQEILDRLVLQGCELRPTGFGCDYSVAGRQGVLNPVVHELRRLGLWGHLSQEKFIPEAWMRAEPEQRLELLRGLMDTDGTVDDRGACEFSTSSPVLAEQVAELVRSLGGVVGWTGKGVRVKKTTHLDSYRVAVRLPVCPFHLQRKSERWRKPERVVRSLRSWRPVAPDHAVCISVDAEDELFAAEGYSLTHNTVFLLNVMDRMRRVKGQEDLGILFFSLEQTRGEWWDRARRIYRFYNMGEHDDKAAMRWWRDNIYLVDKNRVSEQEVRIAIDDFTEQRGRKPDLICLDYIGYFAQSFPGERYERVSNAMMAIKAVGKDTLCPILAPHQVSRVGKDGEEFGIDAARDTGVIEETADFVVPLWTPDNALGRSEEEKTGVIHGRIGKSRHGGRGVLLKLQFAPLSLVMLPESDPKCAMARREIQWRRDYRDNWPKAVYRHQTGYEGHLDEVPLMAEQGDLDEAFLDQARELEERRFPS